MRSAVSVGWIERLAGHPAAGYPRSMSARVRLVRGACASGLRTRPRSRTVSRVVSIVSRIVAAGLVAGGVAVGALGLPTACLPPEEEVPLDEPVFPTGLAIAGDNLLVVSSNFDLRFRDGALLVGDLTTVREESREGDASVVVEGAYDNAALLAPFGEKPAVTSGGERAYVPTRRANVINAVDISPDGALECGGVDGATPRCQEPFALQLQDNDPFDIVILGEQREDGVLVRTDALVANLASPRLVLFSDDVRREGAERMRIEGSVDLGEDVAGVRSALLRPAVAGTDPVIIAGADIAPAGGSRGAILAVLQPRTGSPVERFDVTDATGALSLREVVLVPGDDGDNDALIVALRGISTSGPEALARFEIDDDGGLPSLRLSTLASSCVQPTSLAYARIPTAGGEEVDRVLVTCQTSEAVEAVDPVTLQPTDAVRFAGRGPYDVVVSTAVDPPEAYVSFFLDNSIGILHLVDDEGEPRLVFRGRIGEQAPQPETGRE